MNRTDSLPRHADHPRVLARRWLRLVILGAAVALQGCDRAQEIDVPPPLVVDDPTDSLAPIEPSIIDSEVRYDLDPVMASLEQAVPRTFGDITKKLPVENNRRAHFAFGASRTPFRITFDGERATITSVIEYEGRGWYNSPLAPEVSAACGTGGVPRPRMRVRLVSNLALTKEWELRARTRIASMEPMTDTDRDRCRVTPFRIDVTDRVSGATRGVLEKQLLGVDRAIARVKTRERFERWWRDMSRPIRLTDSVWFTINPADVRLLDIHNDSGSLVAGLRLTARPRIETGNRPNDFDLFTPLPPLLRADTATRGMHVTLDGELDYGVGSAILRRALVDKRIDIGKRKLVIRDVELRGIGGGRVALGVRFGGAVTGLVFLTGTPSYDAAADQLHVPDLDYDLYTSNALVQGLAWLKDGAILSFLRERARFPVDSQLDRLRELAESGMNRDLTEGVRIVAQLDRSQAVGVRAFRSALRVRATATGNARLEIDKPMRLPAAKEATGKRE